MFATINKTISFFLMSSLLLICVCGILPGCSEKEKDSNDPSNYETPFGEEIDHVEELRKRHEKK